jgi:zinc/manganese transport system substrate-binding protein
MELMNVKAQGRRTPRLVAAVLAALALLAAGCGDDDGDAGAGDGPTVVVTTNILGDVVGEIVGDQADVITIMPVGADPHDFQASAQQVAQIGDADVLIVNGADFEENLLDVIESAESDGVPVHEAISAVTTIDFGDADHDHSAHEHEDDHDDEADHDDHDDEADEADHDHDHGHSHEGVDPHFFTDPARMAVAVQGIADFLADNVDGIDADDLATSTDDYLAALTALDADVESELAAVPDDRRILVTNHEVFGYFADRYGFEIVGTVIPGGTTADSASAQALAELAEIVEQEGVPAVFSDTSASAELAETLADEVGGVEVVALYSESLGTDDEAATYLAMVRTNAERIAAALG